MIASLYIIASVIFRFPVVQSFMGNYLENALSKSLECKVSVGRISIGLANRIIIDDVYIEDRNNQELLGISRMCATLNITEMLQGRILLSSCQLFGLNANIYKTTPQDKPNYQFLIDALSSDEPQDDSILDLKISSFIIRRGNVNYHVLSVPRDTTIISKDNIYLRNISGHMILDKLNDDSLSFKLKRLTMDCTNGLTLKHMSFDIYASHTALLIKNFKLELPNSSLKFDSISATYRFTDNVFDKESLHYKCEMLSADVTPSDLYSLVPLCKRINKHVDVSLSLNGTYNSINVSPLLISMAGNDIMIKSTVNATKNNDKWHWVANLSQAYTSSESIDYLFQSLDKKIPDEIARLGDVEFSLMAEGNGLDYEIQGDVVTEKGNVIVSAVNRDKKLKCSFETANLNIGRIIDNDRLDILAAKIDAEIVSLSDIQATLVVSRLDLGEYSCGGIEIVGKHVDDVTEGTLRIRDTECTADVYANVRLGEGIHTLKVNAEISDFSPNAMQLTDKWENTLYNAKIQTDIRGNTISDVVGVLRVNDILVYSPNGDCRIDSIVFKSEAEDLYRRITLDSDFGNVLLEGTFNASTLTNSLINIIGEKIPFISQLSPSMPTHNQFSIDAQLNNTDWINSIFNIPLHLSQSLDIHGSIDDDTSQVNIVCNFPSLTYDGKNYEDGNVIVEQDGDTLKAYAGIKVQKEKSSSEWMVNAAISHNNISTIVGLNDHGDHSFNGKLIAKTKFYDNLQKYPDVVIDIADSDISVGDTLWRVQPSTIIYKQGIVSVDNFSVTNGNQFISADGKLGKTPSDSLRVDFNDVNVRYILDLVNFHAVEFDGLACGSAYISGALSESPQAVADVVVNEFRFQEGRMGTLNASVVYDNIQKHIAIDAIANDEHRTTCINGYVSPADNDLRIDFVANDTRIEFLESFCGSFMRDINASANGTLCLLGQLNDLNLTGMLVANGNIGISSLNTNYKLVNDTILFIPNDIKFLSDTIYDSHGNNAVVNGAVHHTSLKNISYDISISANEILAFDTDGSNGDVFYGTVYANGTCDISGRSGEVVMDIDVTPCKNTIVTYDSDSQEAVAEQEFIRWRKHEVSDMGESVVKEDADIEMASDLRMNFQINATTDATLKVIMDRKSGDYIALQGNGVLRAVYYNKGALDIFGNYVVDDGVYKLTIQNIMKKEFVFESNGLIAFGGNPLNATLDLKAIYVLNGVSLSDLNIGRSFSGNNICVNCIMNITGTTMAPIVDFSLDMPSLNTDAKQMVYSVLNAEEEMNQQVLYLLAVGRFYTQSSNNSETGTSTSQTSLAMQSILSSTVSQQINNILGSVINISNWNFGANISTGTEGLNNAEYEGILSGRMLNNRLLLNGQFGYRDNVNATTSFIGDFDLKYLLYPNGNLAINVYNKTNDRYFTHSTLNTQGVGLLMKKDFSSFSELFNRGKTYLNKED